jgi:hypothetical protein
MTRTSMAGALLSAAALVAQANSAEAAILTFSGSATATPVVAPDASCAPLPFRGIIAPAASSGESNFGSFLYSHNVCTQGATGPVVGTFSIDFGVSSFSGSLIGASVARAGTPGLFDQTFDYTITGGTGSFLGATGSFVNVGTVDTRGGPPSRLALNFNGQINAPAVPEPTTWSLMIAGFGLVGAAIRRRSVNPHFFRLV